MDFKKTHDGVPHQLSFDPSGIDICGNGHVNINMHTRTIDIECDTIDISGTIKMDDTHVQKQLRGWFGPMEEVVKIFLGVDGLCLKIYHQAHHRVSMSGVQTVLLHKMKDLKVWIVYLGVPSLPL